MVSPSLISLMVSVDVKHHVYLLRSHVVKTLQDPRQQLNGVPLLTSDSNKSRDFETAVSASLQVIKSVTQELCKIRGGRPWPPISPY